MIQSSMITEELEIVWYNDTVTTPACQRLLPVSISCGYPASPFISFLVVLYAPSCQLPVSLFHALI